ncbi:MAG TPA: DJ-1/PfpI family protein [Phenylobacterium sp.]|nr:DJ-1/PfpI family protein [Phenylobacterium sp.]
MLLFDDVEVLDFAGPFEVFGVARTASGAFAFEVFTVALEHSPVTARNGLQVLPHASTAHAGQVDVLVVPGGFGTRREMHNDTMLDIVRELSASADLTLSVCTGALVLGAAGLLRGLAATTHYGALDELRALDCAAVLPDARIVDNGHIVTSAGVSAGIDAALHIVGRLVGGAAAAETARYMQYDWRPEAVGPGVHGSGPPR